MAMTMDYVCIPGICTQTSKEFFIQCYKAYDGTWVYTRTLEKAPIVSRSEGSGEPVLLTPIRTGPQYACPYCGRRNHFNCWNCGKESCFDGDTHDGREVVCLHCGKAGVFHTSNKRNRSAGVSGNGQ